MQEKIFNYGLNHYRRSIALAVLVLLSLCILNSWLFSQLFNNSYLAWYVNAGPVIGLVTTVAAVVWGGFDKEPGLISKNPYKYIGSYLLLTALTLFSLATIIDTKNHSKRPSLLDHILGLFFSFILIITIFIWLLIIVPFQYFVFLISGAIPRLSLNASTQLVAWFAGSQLNVAEHSKSEEVSNGRWIAMFANQPFKVTSAFSIALLFLLRQVLLLVGS